jgi:hypothetical protein
MHSRPSSIPGYLQTKDGLLDDLELDSNVAHKLITPTLDRASCIAEQPVKVVERTNTTKWEVPCTLHDF